MWSTTIRLRSRTPVEDGVHVNHYWVINCIHSTDEATRAKGNKYLHFSGVYEVQERVGLFQEQLKAHEKGGAMDKDHSDDEDSGRLMVAPGAMGRPT